MSSDNERRAIGADDQRPECDLGARLGSRDPLLRCLETQWRWCRRQQHPVCLMLIAVETDDSPQSAMATVASSILRGCRRRADYAGLIATEKFAVLLADADADGAGVVAERILGLISAADGPPVAVSIGAACMVPHSSPHVMDLVARAEEALADAGDSAIPCIRDIEDPESD